MSDYEEIMNSLVKFRNHCKKQRSCNHCKFQGWCDMNIVAVDDAPTYWVFDGEE